MRLGIAFIRKIGTAIVLFSVLSGAIGCTTPSSDSRRTVKESLSVIQLSPDFVEILPSEQITIDLRYATANNFVGRNLYGEFNRAYLHRIAAEKLARAAENLKRLAPGMKLIIFDALRPRSVQFILWEKVRGTDQQEYVADPNIGSIHNYGFAVDLSIIDSRGRELDMGTPFDAFTPLAQAQLEDRFLREKKLSEAQLKNRYLLRKVMQDAGFIQLPIEWWHYDALPKAEVLGKFPRIE